MTDPGNDRENSMASHVYHVVPDGVSWHIKQEGSVVKVGTFYSKEAAITCAINTARSNQPSQLKIHRRNGTIESEYTYGGDPYPPRG